MSVNAKKIAAVETYLELPSMKQLIDFTLDALDMKYYKDNDANKVGWYAIIEYGVISKVFFKKEDLPIGEYLIWDFAIELDKDEVQLFIAKIVKKKSEEDFKFSIRTVIILPDFKKNLMKTN